MALIVIISVGTMSTGVFVALEKHALHHPNDVPRWLRWLDFDWPDLRGAWRQIRARALRKRDKKRDGCCIENDEEDDGRGMTELSPSSNKALVVELKAVDIEGVAEDAVHGNCLSTNEARKISSPKVSLEN